jgi:ABC-type multidrug transport system fused ATPase/permease subunit
MFYRVPIGFALSTSLSWRMLGPSSMAGVGVLVFAQILSVFVARVVRNRDRTRRTFTDKRLQETTQFIEAIRHLRWYGWADHWQQRILGARLSELNARIVTQLWNIVLWMVNALGCDLMVFCSLAAYVLIYNHELRVDVAFPALELLGMVQNSFREVPDLFLTWIQAQVAIKRLEEFMAEPNKEDGAAGGISPPTDEIIELKKASYIWPGTKDPVLKNLDLSFPPGLHIITGGVAAGKSALLKALLGELDLVSGEVVSYKDAIAYCAQQPWLQSMSVRDNILFVSKYDETRYRKVIEACALITDFEGFKEGDKSAIGENGIGLSGGQKSRVALARALYSDARGRSDSLYLLMVC